MIIELRERENDLIKEIDNVNLSTQKLIAQYNSLNSVYSSFEQKDIQISSNIHAIKIQTENIKSNNNHVQSKIPKDLNFPIPKENIKYENELKDRRKRREKALELINEMHNEGIKQIELIEKNSKEEESNLMQKIQHLSQKKIETKELIGNVEHEFDDVRKKLEDEIQDFRSKSFSPDQEKVMFLRNELEILNAQIDSTEKEINDKRNKLNEMSLIQEKLKKFLDDKNNLFQKEISSRTPVLDNQNAKISKLKGLIQKKQQINKDLENEMQSIEPKFKKVDYLQVYKKQKFEMDDKFSQLHKEEAKKKEEIDKKLLNINDHIKSLQAICDDHQHSLDLLNESKRKLLEQTEKINKKDNKLVQLIKQANCELNGLKEMLKADDLSTKNIKILPVHVKSYIKLPDSTLNIEQAIKNQHKNLVDKIKMMNIELSNLDQKEQKIKKYMGKLQQENNSLKKLLAPYPKIRRFYKKYLIPKNTQQNSSQLMIKTQQATISVPNLTLECQKINIH